MHLTVVITDCNPDSNSDFEKPEDRANKRLHNGRATAPVSRSVGAIRRISSDISIEQSKLHHQKPYK